MTEYILPKIWMINDIAKYLKVDESVILNELGNGNLHGFKVGNEWRCSDEDILTYIKKPRRISAEEISPFQDLIEEDTDWEIVETGPFDFDWPAYRGKENLEHYEKGYEASKTMNGQRYSLRIGFGRREAAGKLRCRVTIWIGKRAIVEFAGSNDFDSDGLLAGIIRLRNGPQLTPYQKIPDEYKGFRLARYNTIVQGPRASTNMAVVVHKDDLKSMLKHALIRATWKQLL